MCRLSVNINKIATIRNARGGNIPNLIEAAQRIESYGGQGITVHPRPDERHIRYQDVRELRSVVKTELNVEGYPSEDWVNLVIESQADQATLVPDSPDAITSNAGWDTVRHADLLAEVVAEIKAKGIRASIFVDPNMTMLEGALKIGADAIELYTEPYADGFVNNPEGAVHSFASAAKYAHDIGLLVNSGHDLNLQNLQYFYQNVPHLHEVSIGHALISDALYFGLENTIQMYLSKLS